MLPLVFSGINPLANSDSCRVRGQGLFRKPLKGGAGPCWSLGRAALIEEVGGKDLSPIEAR